jgi:CRISPR-associated endoribonuclease Cas6
MDPAWDDAVMVMPTIFTIEFRPERPFTRPVAPQDLHRLACYLLERPGREVHADQNKAFSVWPLEVHNNGELVGTQPPRVGVRLCQLDDDPARVEQLVRNLEKQPNLGVEHPLMALKLDVVEVAAHDLVPAVGASQVDVEFLSPTHFSRNGRRYCLPDPVLVWGRLADRWNVHVGEAAALHIDEDLRRDVARNITLTHCDICTVGPPHRPDGFLGQVGFSLGSRPEPLASQVFNAVWRFAELCGVGALTTQGFGAVEVTVAA